MKKLTIFLFLLTPNCFAQFLSDKQSTQQVLEGLDYLYNLQFSKAAESFAPVKIKYADHPVKPLLNALQLEWSKIPIDQNPTALNSYLEELNKCVLSAKKYYEKPGYQVESTFFLLASYGFKALAENYKGSFFSAVQEARYALKYFNEGKEYKSINPEFLYATGMYNYYRVQYPETKPIIKPVMAFFEAGDRALGLRELEKAYKTSVFSRVEAALALWGVNIKYEANFKRALLYSNELNSKYPNNYLFRINHIESLLLNNSFEEAEALNESLSSRTDPVSKLSYNMFDGYLLEHKNRDFDAAEAAYKRALKVKYNNRYTREYVAYCYLGLARIAKYEGNKPNARIYYKQCLKFAEYAWLVNAAKKELRTVS